MAKEQLNRDNFEQHLNELGVAQSNIDAIMLSPVRNNLIDLCNKMPDFINGNTIMCATLKDVDITPRLKPGIPTSSSTALESFETKVLHALHKLFHSCECHFRLSGGMVELYVSGCVTV